MQITKTIPVLQGELVLATHITIDIKNGIFVRGFVINQSNDVMNDFSGQVTITEIFSELTATEIDAVKKFIKIGTYKSGNVGVDPDTPLILTDIADEL